MGEETKKTDTPTYIHNYHCINKVLRKALKLSGIESPFISRISLINLEVKTVQARLEKSQKVHIWKNIIIFVLLLVLICLVGYVFYSSTISKTENVGTKKEQMQPAPAQNINIKK